MLRSAYQPEGRQAKSDNHRTDYEGPAALQKFSGKRVSPLQASGWTKRGVRVSRRLLVTFVRTKVTRGPGVEPPLKGTPKAKGLKNELEKQPPHSTGKNKN